MKDTTDDDLATVLDLLLPTNICLTRSSRWLHLPDRWTSEMTRQTDSYLHKCRGIQGREIERLLEAGIGDSRTR